MDLSMDLDFEYGFGFFFLIFKIYTQIHTQKIKMIFFILNYLFRNLQEIRKILRIKLKTEKSNKKFKTQTQT
jgi:hypothetical protein